MTCMINKSSWARTYLIFSSSQDLPMGEDNEVIRKNFYVNIGANQGIQAGALLSVFRVLSRDNPYAAEKKVFYKIKIGELKVLHTEDENSIAILSKLDITSPTYFDIKGLMIGDHVEVKIE